MSALTVAMLMFPGSLLEELWRLNPVAHEGFLRIGHWAVLLMLLVSTSCALAAFGLWRLRPWGKWMAIGIFFVNLIGDTVNALVIGDGRTLIGVPFALVMIAFLVRRSSDFSQTAEP
jgi:uncharacterized membrane protein (DUF2068 family)